jgi:hypothetical protein
MDSGHILDDELSTREGTYDMVNVRPELSGLPFIVWISEKGRSRHDVRVKIAPGPRVRDFVASLSVRPDIAIMAGALSNADFELARRWIALNRDAIIRFWDGDILYSDEVLAALQRLED